MSTTDARNKILSITRSLNTAAKRRGGEDAIEVAFIAKGNEERLRVGRIPTGIHNLDELIGGGWQRGGFSMLWGSPGAGKTCLPGDTWVMTTLGPRKITSLLEKPFMAAVDGGSYQSAGFFKTGDLLVFEIKTDRGYTLKATANHDILVRYRMGRTKNVDCWLSVDKLQPGDEIVLDNHRNLNWVSKGSYLEGWLLGNLIAGGLVKESPTIPEYQSENQAAQFCSEESTDEKTAPINLTNLCKDYGIHWEYKTVSQEIEEASSEFYKGFLQAWFDAAGSVHPSSCYDGAISLSSNLVVNLQAAQRMLARLGIISTLYTDTKPVVNRFLQDSDAEITPGSYKPDHKLIITYDNLDEFKKRIDFCNRQKQAKLEEIIRSERRVPTPEPFTARVVDIVPVGVEAVYDCTVDSIHRFDANGIVVHNCLAMETIAHNQRLAKAQDREFWAIYWHNEAAAFPYDNALTAGVDFDTLVILDTQRSGEQVLNTLTKYLWDSENNRPLDLVDLVVIDSVASVEPEAEVNSIEEKGLEGNTVGRHAALFSKYFRHIAGGGRLGRYTSFLLINQVRQKVDSYGGGETVTGGQAMEFYPKIAVKVSAPSSKRIKEGTGKSERIIGHTVCCRITKNNTGVGSPFAETEYVVHYGKGVDTIPILVDHAQRTGVILQSSPGRFQVGYPGTPLDHKNIKVEDGVVKILGGPVLEDWVRNDSRFREWLEAQIVTKITDKSIMDVADRPGLAIEELHPL